MYISFRFYRSFDEFNSEGEFQRENTKSTVGINDQSEINGKKTKTFLFWCGIGHNKRSVSL